MKKRIYNLLSVSKTPGDTSWWFDLFLIILISLNVIAIVIESVEPIRQKYEALFKGLELVSVIIFSIEYVLRIWTANEIKRFHRPITGNIRYALTPLAIVDLFAILPFYLPFIGLDLRVVRVMRLFRLFRLFKIARYVKALTVINNVFKERREELFIAIIFTFFLLLFTSTLMYYVEHEAQPESFASIPETMWWSIATLTTVGYGDIYPITALGKLLGGIIAVLGIGLFALPAGILASGFSEHLTKTNSKKDCCPHCGQELKRG
ncbi:ion transporter [Pontibacter silvestris]|uniref:Ion transporter n=1 Tax=Pontibacter silvestris TaxID=2305183 RepID=A0ABW4WZJ9_9BACT|nr:ion transporter [Pontibacter silvestris]MCC9135629.1 ion transporter [Pontibacter silvestris]